MPFRQPIDVNRVRELLAQGMKQAAIAERLGICKQTVCLIANGKYKAA